MGNCCEPLESERENRQYLIEQYEKLLSQWLIKKNQNSELYDSIWFRVLGKMIDQAYDRILNKEYVTNAYLKVNEEFLKSKHDLVRIVTPDRMVGLEEYYVGKDLIDFDKTYKFKHIDLDRNSMITNQ